MPPLLYFYFEQVHKCNFHFSSLLSPIGTLPACPAPSASPAAAPTAGSRRWRGRTRTQSSQRLQRRVNLGSTSGLRRQGQSPNDIVYPSKYAVCISVPCRNQTSKPPLASTFRIKKSYEYEDRFAIANFFFEEPYITKITKDAKISTIGKLVQ